jgi:predicted permease
VTNLFLVRAIQRRHEMAVRLQLGAARGRLVRQLLAESLLVSLMGGVAALLLAYWARPLVRTFLLPPNSYQGDFLGWRVVGLTACFATLAGVVGGLWPFSKVSHQDISYALKSDRPLQERSTARSILLAAQVALTLLLNVGAALFVRSLRNVHAIPLGFDASHVLVAIASTSGHKPADINAAYERMRLRAQAMPGVERAALAAAIPFYGYSLGTFRIPATNSSPARQVATGINSVGPDYFATMGMKILRGRSFLPSEGLGTPPVTIVNESMAKDLAQEGNALGKCVMTYDRKDCLQVVGVVPDEKRQFLFDDVPGQPKDSVYIPLYQAAGQFEMVPIANGLLIRTRGNPSAIERDVASALGNVALGSRYVSVRPITDQIDHQTLPWRMGANVLTLFAVLALLLAAVGISGLLAFLVKYRTAEIGLRLALGAMPRDILALIFRRGMLLVAAGIAIGAGAAVALARLMQSLLFGVAPTDPASYALAAGVVILVALLACYIPARRATRVDPMVALRHE